MRPGGAAIVWRPRGSSPGDFLYGSVGNQLGAAVRASVLTHIAVSHRRVFLSRQGAGYRPAPAWPPPGHRFAR